MRSLLAAVEQSDASISLSFVRDEEIRIVNRDHRGKDKPTDVLSFPMSTEDEFSDAFELPPEAAVTDGAATALASVNEADADAEQSDEADADAEQSDEADADAAQSDEEDASADEEFDAEQPSEGHSADIERMLGDIMISLDTARRQAADYDAPLIDEVERLLIHGVLHLLGHDHEEAGERAIMEAEERRLASIIGLPWPYLDHAPAHAAASGQATSKASNE